VRRGLPKEKGRDLLTLRHRHANAFTGTLSDTPGLGVLSAMSCDYDFAFRDGQQPKPQIWFLFGYIRFFRPLTIESNGGDQCKNCWRVRITGLLKEWRIGFMPLL